MKRLLRALCGLFQLCAVAAPQSADEAVPPPTESRFRHTFQLDTLDDIDGDGVAEVLVGCPHVSTAREGTGVVFVLSGRSAKPIHTLLPPKGIRRLALAVTTMSDVDEDGVEDFAVGGERSPGLEKDTVVIAYSGKTGTVLWKQELAEGGGRIAALEAIGDRDGDGLGDLVAAMPGEDAEQQHPGVVQVISGSTGKSLQVLRPGENTVDFGRSVAEVRDVNGDGVRDLVIVARWLVDTSERGYFGRLRSRRYWARIYCGRDGADLGPPAGAEDERIRRVWSLDGGEAIVLAVPRSTRPGAPDPGLVDRLRAEWGGDESPSAGLLCQHPTDPAVRWFVLGGGGGGVCELGDVDGDGVSDLAAGHPDRLTRGAFSVVSGEGGELLLSVSAWDAGLTEIDCFGAEACSIGDFDGDAVPDLCVSTETEWGREDSPPSRLYWFSVGRKKLVRFLHVEGETAKLVDLGVKRPGPGADAARSSPLPAAAR